MSLDWIREGSSWGRSGKKMGCASSLLFAEREESTPEPSGWQEIVSEELEGVSDWGCPTTKKKVAVPYPDDKVRNLGVTSSDLS